MGVCKYKKICKDYLVSSACCNETGGMYYGDEERPAGCYRKKEAEEKNGHARR